MVAAGARAAARIDGAAERAKCLHRGAAPERRAARRLREQPRDAPCKRRAPRPAPARRGHQIRAARRRGARQGGDRRCGIPQFLPERDVPITARSGGRCGTLREYGKSDVGQGRAVTVEVASVDPEGPLHAGHARQAAFGASVAALLEAAGYRVVRECRIAPASRSLAQRGSSAQRPRPMGAQRTSPHSGGSCGVRRDLRCLGPGGGSGAVEGSGCRGAGVVSRRPKAARAAAAGRARHAARVARGGRQRCCAAVLCHARKRSASAF